MSNCPHDYRFKVYGCECGNGVSGIWVSGTCDTPEKFAYLCDKLATFPEYSTAVPQDESHD